MSVLWSIFVEVHTASFVGTSDDGAVVLSVAETLKAVRSG